VKVIFRAQTGVHHHQAVGRFDQQFKRAAFPVSWYVRVAVETIKDVDGQLIYLRHLLPAGKGTQQGMLVGVFQVASHGQTARQAGNLQAQRKDLAAQVQSRGIAFHAWVGGQDNLLDQPQVQTFQQGFYLQIVRTDPLNRRKHAVQNMILAAEGTRTLDRQHIQGFFHHAQQGFLALGALADLAALTPGRGDMEALAAKGGLGLQFGQGFGQPGCQVFGGAQKEESQAGSGLGADARQPFKRMDQVLYGNGKHNDPGVRRAVRPPGGRDFEKPGHGIGRVPG